MLLTDLIVESSMVDTVVKIGELYRQLPEEKKLELKVEADKLLDDYHQQVEEWKSIIGYVGVKQLQNENKKQREIKKKKLQKQTIKKLFEENNRPKPPHGAFFAFLKDERERALASGRELATFTQGRKQNFQFHAELNQKWKQMSAEEKLIYSQRAHVELEDFNKKMVDWEKDMIKAGMVSLVRKKTLQELKLKTPQEGQVKSKAKKRGNTTKGKAKVKSARTKSIVNVERTGTKDKAKVESTGTKGKAKVESTGTKGKTRSKKNQIESSSSDED